MKQESFFAQVEVLFREPTFQVLTLVCGVYGLLWLRILRRTGLSPILGVLMLVPPLTLLLPFYMAFKRWPVERPVMRTKIRKVPVQSIRRYALPEQSHTEPMPLTVPRYMPVRPTQATEVYAGRDFVPPRLRPGSWN